MLVSTQNSFLAGNLSYKESIRILKEAGFDAYDMTLCSLYSAPDTCIFSGDDYLEKAKELREYADQIGIVCNQAHAPFEWRMFDAEREKFLDETIMRSVEIASVLGARIIVIHPKQYMVYADHAEELFNINMQYYKDLIPYAKKYNIKIAVENMYQCNNGAHTPTDSTCARAWEFCKYLDTIDSEWIVGCLDIGHASLMAADIPDFIRKLGNKRLQALHIHDTDFIHDSHTVPFEEKINYIEVAKALGEIGYNGDITFEADCFYNGKPKGLYQAAARYMCEVGKFLASEVEKNRK